MAAHSRRPQRCTTGGTKLSRRRLIYLLLFPVPWIVIGVFCLALVIAGAATDALGFYFALVFGTVCLGLGALQLWRFSVADPKTPPYPTVDDLPLQKRAGALRRLMLVFGAVIILGSAVTTYQLLQLAYGWEEKVSVWAPVADLYNHFGFWPAVLLIPAIGLLGLVEAARKLRAIRKATQSVPTGSE